MGNPVDEDVFAELVGVVEKLTERVDVLEKNTVKKAAGLFGGKGKEGRMATKDTQTGIVYVSKSALGKALATEADTGASDHFAWYKLTKKFPERFVEASEAEKAKAEAEAAAQAEKERVALQAKLDAEAAAKYHTGGRPGISYKEER